MKDKHLNTRTDNDLLLITPVYNIPDTDND